MSALDGYRRTTVGFIWQQSSRNLVPYLTAEENVTLPMTFAGATPREKSQRAEELLDAVGLSARRRHRLAQMSGGEQQRVAIAVALANRPKLLLGDEPTGEVDTTTALAIYDLLRELNQRYDLTTCIVSHDQAIARHVDRVVAIRDGKTSTETIRQTFAANQTGDGSETTSTPQTTSSTSWSCSIRPAACRCRRITWRSSRSTAARCWTSPRRAS